MCALNYAHSGQTRGSSDPTNTILTQLCTILTSMNDTTENRKEVLLAQDIEGFLQDIVESLERPENTPES